MIQTLFWESVSLVLSNTQNKIDARNFVALDAEQERIRTKLLIDKVNYEYREGEPLKSTVDGFEFIEAVTALACAGEEMSYVALIERLCRRPLRRYHDRSL